MDEFAATAAAEAVSMEVDFEDDAALGEQMDTDGRPCDHKSTESDAPAKMPDESKKREGPEAPKLSAKELGTEKLKSVVEKVCVGKEGYPETGHDGAIVSTVTNKLSWDIRALLCTLYSTRRSSVRWVKLTQQLDQEEALAYVLADLCGYELLPEEARKIGEQARLAAVTYKGKPPGAKGAKPKVPPADQALKDQASKDKYAAKAAAAKDAALNTELEQRIADIDAVLAAQRDRLAHTVVPLSWPARNSVVRERPPPKPQPPASKLKQLRKEAARLEEAVAAADADCVAAGRIAQRASALAQAAAQLTWRAAVYGDGGDEAWAELTAQRDEAQRDASEARCDHIEARHLLATLRDELEEAQRAVREEEEAQAEARRVADDPVAEPSELANELAVQLKLERERTLADLDERTIKARERTAAALAALNALRPSALPPTPSTDVPPRVFKLTGDVSPARMRSIASEVSQASTGLLEHDRSAWDRYDRAISRIGQPPRPPPPSPPCSPPLHTPGGSGPPICQFNTIGMACNCQYCQTQFFGDSAIHARTYGALERHRPQQDLGMHQRQRPIPTVPAFPAFFTKVIRSLQF